MTEVNDIARESLEGLLDHMAVTLDDICITIAPDMSDEDVVQAIIALRDAIEKTAVILA